MHLPSEILKSCWFLAGPTACGKSQVGVELAERLDGEIVSMDSMSVYCGMDVGTAKPSPALRARIPHHLIDVLEPHQEFSVAEYVAAADRAAASIVARGKTPVFVGGTGLYLRSLLRGVCDAPQADPRLRSSLQAEAEQMGSERLHERLRGVDSASAGRLHPRDVRRIIRSLEVIAQTGQPLSQLQRQAPLPSGERPCHVYWLAPPRRWLYERVDRRVEQMLADGLLDEVRRLLTADQPLSRTARQALGYKEAIDNLEGKASLEETVMRIQTRTRQFAKRQHTWFRHLCECRPIEMAGDETFPQLAERILATATA